MSAVFLAVTGVSFGSGFSIYEQGAKATGMGGAFVATADDPSAIFYNVAGIAQQRHFSIMTGATVINFSNQFEGDPNDPFTAGVTAEYRAHTFVIPNFYATVPIGTNLTFGLGVFTPFGLRTNWEKPFPGRFISSDANIKTLSVEPSVAWQTSDGRVAIGVGAEYRRSHVILQRNNGTLNPFTQRYADVANVYLGSDWNNAWGYNVGILLKPTQTLRIGASYRSDMDVDQTGSATFSQISTGNAQLDAIVKAGLPPNQDIRTTLSYPSIAAVGIATSAIEGWDLEADVTRTTWSKFESLDVTFVTTPANNLHRLENWHDTYSYRIGGNRRINEQWDVRLGALYDENPQDTKTVSPLLPDADRVGATFGVAYRTGPWTLEATEFVLHFLDRNTFGQNTDGFNGEYKTDANLISVNVGYKF
jgi:long-chain fatty acid transport protein